jgi:hypothetical protein
MGSIEAIRKKVQSGQWEFSRHAVSQCLLRAISVADVRDCLLTGEIIENYPRDKYGPSCLVLGEACNGRMLHVHCSDASRALVKIVTAYEPDPRRWREHRFRRPSGPGGFDGD